MIKVKAQAIWMHLMKFTTRIRVRVRNWNSNSNPNPNINLNFNRQSIRTIAISRR
jgi:hypothetical protein